MGEGYATALNGISIPIRDHSPLRKSRFSPIFVAGDEERRRQRQGHMTPPSYRALGGGSLCNRPPINPDPVGGC